jgi:UDP-glucose 4-epimerase
MKKVVVTGGAGFIGSTLADALIGEGFEVHIIDDLSQGKKENIHPKAVFHQADIRDLAAIKPIVAGSEYVFHCAALARVQFSIEHPIEAHDVNVNGTQNVLIASAEGKVKKLIYSASSSVYGDSEVMPTPEDAKPNPKSPYGLHKYVGEVYAKTWTVVYGLPTVSLRYFNVYGARQSAEGAYALVIARFLKQKSEGKPLTITGDGEQTRDFTHVRDVVRANILAATKDTVGKGESINIGSGKSYSVNQIAAFIGGPVEHVPARLEPKHTLADNSLAKKLLGWTPQENLEEAIKELM